MNLHGYNEWQKHLARTGPRLSDVQQEACARLAIVLLAGEQSAIRIFSAEVQRGRAPAVALDALRGIEADEQWHEQALQAFCTFLPTPEDGHRLKRRAQHFFARISQVNDMARHFGQISDLDSAVCKIMWHVETGAVPEASALRWIATEIKQDEARHVSISRQYAELLGQSREQRQDDRALLLDGLVEMLDPLTDSFELLGIDSDQLFTKLRKPVRW